VAGRSPLRPLNTYSLLTLGPAALALLFVAGWLLHAPWLGIVLAAVGAAVLGVWAWTMRSRSAPIESFEALQAALRSGRPTVMEVFSNY
jgi:Flp pilus assembly protein TadB